MRLQIAIVAVVMAAGALATNAAAAAPTPLRLEAHHARDVFTDSERFAVIEQRRHIEILDTFTDARRRVSASGCRVSSVSYFQTHVAAGRAALRCPGGPELLDLATGARTPLPARLTIGGTEVGDVSYVRVGEWWAESSTYVACGAENVWCTVYVNHRTGEQRVVADDRGSEQRSFVDVDDPGLRRIPLCRPHHHLGNSLDRDIGGAGQRTYDRPYLLDDSTPYRCGSRRKLRDLPEAAPDVMNLSAGLVSWGTPWVGEYRGRGLAYLFEYRTRKLYRWRIPQVARRPERAGAAFHTRRRLIVAVTLKANYEGDPLTVRVYSARLPLKVIRRLARTTGQAVDSGD